MIKTLLSFLFFLGTILVVGALLLPKDVIYRIKERMVAESDSLKLTRYEEFFIVKDIKEGGYIKKYAPLAVSEMRRSGIPASITLAQGLLESNAGRSRIAIESNNHFGIKCKSKCRGCTCRNYADDHIYDMFRVFDTVEECFKARSELLLGLSRYNRLLACPDYKCWAYGLKKAGYATDPDYATKLIKLIESKNLQKYDE